MRKRPTVFLEMTRKAIVRRILEMFDSQRLENTKENGVDVCLYIYILHIHILHVHIIYIFPCLALKKTDFKTSSLNPV